MNPELLKDRIHKSWLKVLSPFIDSKEFDVLFGKIKEEAKSYYITPKSVDLWRAFSYDFYAITTVILGSDPYPTKYVADGLAFSSRIDREPASLWYIYNAIEEEYFQGLNFNMDRRVNLDFLAEQGVLLTNCALTCRVNAPGSHINIWKPFTEYLFKTLNEKKLNIVYLLLGEEAQSYKQYISTKLNTVISIEHPSFNYNKRWEHKGCFVDVNEELKHYGHQEIKWDYSLLNKE